MNRRTFLQSTALAGLAATSCSTVPRNTPTPRLAVSTASYMVRQRFSRRKVLPVNVPVFRDPLHFIEHCHQLGASGVQIGVSDWAKNGMVYRIRDKVEEYGMVLEGQISLPQKREELDEFTNTVKTAKEAGVRIFRTVTLGGRRYETFKSLKEWNEFRAHAWTRLTWAEPIMKKNGVQLALENHKDWRIEGMVDLMQRLSSEHIGVNLDTGNNISLLDGGMETVRALAPYTLSVHLKDMGVAEYQDGFLLSEVPFGEGFLDVRKIIQTCQRANPRVQFNLEMITRDPLKIPCLTEKYWATWETPRGEVLAEALDRVRRHSGTDPLPTISQLDPVAQVEAEETNNQKCFAWFFEAFA